MRRTKKAEVKLIQLKSGDIKGLRKKLFKAQGDCCALLKKKIEWKDASLDHKHKLKHQKSGPFGRGLVRGVLHVQANSFEGKVNKAYVRYGLHKFIELPELLRNLADYLENPPCPQKYIHPSERDAAIKLGKREYKKLVKFYKQKYPNRKYVPLYPKSGKFTKELQQIKQHMEAVQCDG
jgi:hypothetical protein